mmetsp:Transcript_7785/g.11546  ORF Transcript_7785/g.11546 Transcript_7785/m.11546 type:complete len:356 (+) Transcript_7785:110-1177(+)
MEIKKEDIEKIKKYITQKEPNIELPKPPKEPNYRWEFKYGGEWKEFGKEKQKIISEAYDKKEENVSYQNQKEETCSINFRTLVETNKKTKYQRRIRRHDTANDESHYEDKDWKNIKLVKAQQLTNWERCNTMEQFEKIKDQKCPLCYCEFYEDDEEITEQSMYIVRICKDGKKEGHWFHAECIAECYKPHGHYLKCPLTCCVNCYGLEIGDMPQGTMQVNITENSIPAYSKSKTIEIRYSFPGGTQGREHQHPGIAYNGTSRVAFLPDNKEGHYVLKLLKIGWERRLLFRVGKSVTTGADNCVVWNGVHHKTNTTGGSASFGYPDVTYFARVVGELNDKGVTLPDVIEYEETTFE